MINWLKRILKIKSPSEIDNPPNEKENKTMIKFENTQVVGLERAIKSLHNPDSDSYKTYIEDPETLETADYEYFIGENDIEFMMKLRNSYVNFEFLKLIYVYVDITYDVPGKGPYAATRAFSYYELMNDYVINRIELGELWCSWIESLPYSELITGKGECER